MTRWLITGAGGALGSDLVRLLEGNDVVAMDRVALDITAGQVEHTLDQVPTRRRRHSSTAPDLEGWRDGALITPRG